MTFSISTSIPSRSNFADGELGMRNINPEVELVMGLPIRDFVVLPPVMPEADGC
jgi:hypothetical protein